RPLDPAVVDEAPVGAREVGELHPLVVHPQPGVLPRHPLDGEDEIVGLRAPQGALAERQEPGALALLDGAAQAVEDGGTGRAGTGHLRPILSPSQPSLRSMACRAPLQEERPELSWGAARRQRPPGPLATVPWAGAAFMLFASARLLVPIACPLTALLLIVGLAVALRTRLPAF